MKQFIDFIPLILFFIVFKLDPRTVDLLGYSFQLGGIFSATEVLIASSLLVYGALWIKQKRLERNQVITLVACLFFGGLTIAFHSETFLKWKAPIVNWIFALIFLGSLFVAGKTPLIKRMMGHAINLPDAVWYKLNIAWTIFFIFSGAANLFVAFTFPSIWVDFKVFGSLAMTIVFMIAQGVYMARHIQEPPKQENKED
ncbi:septation protein A [Pseudomonas sp. F1_0610]|uniref:septation protein A n=1 Tax=Pseudomonas sp. F1_0610 TaxID=3114284 RepID=UPI0039C22EF5